MFRIIKLFVLLIFISLNVTLTIYSQEINSIAPPFTSSTFDGKTVSLSDFKGKVVIVDFFASWCNPCKRSMPFLNELYNKMKDNGFIIIGINLDKKEDDAKKFLSKLNSLVTFPIIWDKEGSIPLLYKVEAMPTTFIIDKSGKIRLRETGFSEDHTTKYNQMVETLLMEGVN